jgi:hypothetical protein
VPLGGARASLPPRPRMGYGVRGEVAGLRRAPLSGGAARRDGTLPGAFGRERNSDSLQGPSDPGRTEPDPPRRGGSISRTGRPCPGAEVGPRSGLRVQARAAVEEVTLTAPTPGLRCVAHTASTYMHEGARPRGVPRPGPKAGPRARVRAEGAVTPRPPFPGFPPGVGSSRSAGLRVFLW